MTTVNKHKILKNLPIFLSAGLILAASFVFVHFSAKNKNPGQGEVLGQNTLTQTTAQTSPSENIAYGEKSAALQPTPAPESAADQQANKPNAALPDAGKKPDVEHELIPGDPLIRGGGGTGSTNFRGGSGGGGGSGTVSYDNSTSAACDDGTGGGATSLCTDSFTTLTYPLTVGSGSNRALGVFVTVSHNSATVEPSISSITYAGVSLTQKAHVSGNYYTDLWTLPDGIQPTSGTNDVVVVLSSTLSGEILSGAISVSGVDQASTWSATNSNSGNSATASVTLGANGSGDLVISGVCNGTGVTSSSQNQLYIINDTTNYACANIGGDTAPGGTTSLSWNVGNDSWQIIGAAFKAASGGGTNGNVKFR